MVGPTIDEGSTSGNDAGRAAQPAASSRGSRLRRSAHSTLFWSLLFLLALWLLLLFL